MLNLRKHVTVRRGGKGGVNLPRLILMTDELRLPDPISVIKTLPRGSAVILRHYKDPKRASLARALMLLCKQRGVLLLVAGDARMAIKIGANGFHMPEALAMRGLNIWRCWRRSDWIVTAAAHSPLALRQAKKSGADAVLLSPVFKTSSHMKSKPLGPLLFSSWGNKSPLPVYALGGVNAANAAMLASKKCAGFAAISGLMGND